MTARAFLPAGAVAGLLAVASLLVAGSWAGHPGTGPPATVWVAWIGVGATSLVLLAGTTTGADAAGHRFAVFAAVALLAGVGFVLRLGVDVVPSIREWTLFTVAATAFLFADRIGGRLPTAMASRWFAAALAATAVAALVGVVVAAAPNGTRVDARIGHTWPVPVVCVAASGLLALWTGTRRNRPLPLGIQVYLAVMPALALFAFTRDLGAALALAAPVTGVLVAAQLTAWRPTGRARHRRTAFLITAVLLIGAGGVAVLHWLDPGGGFRRPAAGANLFGVDADRAGLTEAVLGIAGLAVLVMVALALAAHVMWLIVRRVDGDGSAWSLWRVGLMAQLVVTLVVPALAAVGGPVPGSLGALPLASDGASFVVTVVSAALIASSEKMRLS